MSNPLDFEEELQKYRYEKLDEFVVKDSKLYQVYRCMEDGCKYIRAGIAFGLVEDTITKSDAMNKYPEVFI